MLVADGAFEDPNFARDLAPELSCLEPASDRYRPLPISAMANIGPRIEAEIPFLRRAVRRWCREAADADDLVQDTLLRALASAHLWQPGSNLRAWLVTI